MSEAANPKLQSIVEAVKNLTVIELVDLVAALKGALGVSDAALAGPAVAVAPAGGGAAPAKAAEEAPTSFKVTLVAGGANKIQAIKIIREITGLGLSEAKAFVEGAPKVVKEGLEKPAAEELAKKIKDTGAEVKIEGA
jgi:large subunit ribosomal protein L7/L12